MIHKSIWTSQPATHLPCFWVSEAVTVDIFTLSRRYVSISVSTYPSQKKCHRHPDNNARIWNSFPALRCNCPLQTKQRGGGVPARVDSKASIWHKACYPRKAFHQIIPSLHLSKRAKYGAILADISKFGTFSWSSMPGYSWLYAE